MVIQKVPFAPPPPDENAGYATAPILTPFRVG